MEAGRCGQPLGRQDARPVYRLPGEDGAGLQEGRGGAVRPGQRDGHPGPGGGVGRRPGGADVRAAGGG